ncbi:MAG: Helix-turn-helix domain [Gammaproteobacteria bacterium]|nr:Helix-turn-helix domain [Gammaproteobacteria bacterium]
MDARSGTPPRIAYSINETAAVLGISRRTVYELLASGQLGAVRIGARQRIPAAELERLCRPAERVEGETRGAAAVVEVQAPTPARAVPTATEPQCPSSERRPRLSELLAQVSVHLPPSPVPCR